MQTKLTPKQDHFCIAYLESGNASAAYRDAYNSQAMKPATINRKAKELLDNGKITARLAQLRAPSIERAHLNLDRHLDILARIRDNAEAKHQFSAAVAAEVARGKAAGLYDKVKAQPPEPPVVSLYLSDEKLKQIFREINERN